MTDRPATPLPGQDPPAQDPPASVSELRRECDQLRFDLAQARDREAAALASAVHWRSEAVRNWAQAGAGTADRREVAILRERADHLRDELERTKKTVSWRVTAPLRRIRRLRPPRATR